MPDRNTEIKHADDSGFKAQKTETKAGVASFILPLSFFINLFSLCVYKYLNFFVIPESVFLCLLLTGIPLGAAVGIKFIKRGSTVAGSIFILILVCVLSYAGIIALSRIQGFLFGGFNTYDGLLMKYLIVFAAALVFFLPFFMAYGFCEFMFYSRTDITAIRIYAGFLGGCALAYLCIKFFVSWTGVCRLSLLSVAGLSYILYNLSDRRTLAAKVFTTAVFLTAVVSFALPGFESGMHHLIFGKPKDRTILFERWNEHCYFSVTGNTVNRQKIYNGNYNNGGIWHFGYVWNFVPDQLPYRLIGNNKDIAVLGSGGGLQIKESLNFSPKSLDAVEVVPAVIHLLKGRYSSEFDDVYNLPFVNTYIMDGRRFLETTDKKYDLIYMASTDGPFNLCKSLLQMHHFLSTKEAFEVIYGHLNKNGILAIRQNNFFRYYFTALEQAGFRVFAYKSRASGIDSTMDYYWMIAVRAADSAAYENYLQKLPMDDLFFRSIGYERIGNVEGYPLQSITDDRPVKGGILLDMTGKAFLPYLFGGLFVMTLLISGTLTAVLRYAWRNKGRVEKAMFWKTSGASLLTGINFVVLQSFLIYRLNRYLDVPLDAVFIGVIAFTLCAAAGAWLPNDKFNRAVFYLSLLAAFAVLVFQGMMPSAAVMALMTVPFVFTGTFFPALLQGNDDKKLAVYVFDGVGAFIGSVISFGIPMLAGFKMFYLAALIVFVLTAFSMAAYRIFWRNYSGAGRY